MRHLLERAWHPAVEHLGQGPLEGACVFLCGLFLSGRIGLRGRQVKVRGFLSVYTLEFSRER